MHDPVHAAALILRGAGPDGVGGPRRICHLAFLCDGWHRAIHGTPLIDGVVTAEDVGPMHLDIVRRVLDPTRGFDPRPKGASLTKAQSAIVSRTISRYAAYDTSELQTMTTGPNTAWHRIYMSPGGRGAPIPGDMIREHFTLLAKAGRLDPGARCALLVA